MVILCLEKCCYTLFLLNNFYLEKKYSTDNNTKHKDTNSLITVTTWIRTTVKRRNIHLFFLKMLSYVMTSLGM